ncbi:AAA family ATPase [Photobacterium leiognathi]|uniref:AAA family ATPase n=1 Tax=Photobacterium leiognathi TaxID=553611 RepID=UPI0029820038|nr:AAA family ATPase [Photobacterium leiognathi]
MLNKIIKITDIGRYKNFNARGESGDLRELTLIYGPNGSGKSTLATIFDSLATKSNQGIRRRRRIPQESSRSEVKLRSDKGLIELDFRSGTGWTQNDLNIAVFDSKFVNKNVYSGDSVFKTQRESLLTLFLNEEGYTLLNDAKGVNKSIDKVNLLQELLFEKIKKVTDMPKALFCKSFKRDGEYLNNNATITELLKDAVFKSQCVEFFEFEQQRVSLVREIRALKKRIIDIAVAELIKHQSVINKYLKKLSANFSITDIGVSTFDSNLTQSVKYSIQLGDYKHDVCIANGSKPNRPHFETLLSDAEKRTLSFAFFMSKIELNPRKQDMIVVFDDPMSSFDSARKMATKQTILSVSEEVAQVIVLSHEPEFLALFWKDSKVKNPSLIKINKLGGLMSELDVWDIETEVESQYVTNYKMLQSFVDGNQVCERTVAVALRTTLEEHYRLRFPLDFTQKEWMGDFLGKIRNAADCDSLAAMKEHLDELSMINEYSSPFHHAPQPEIDIDELFSFAKRTLEVMRK